MINTFHFQTSALQTDLAPIALALMDFYNGANTTPAYPAIRTYMSPVLQTTGNVHEIRFYDLADAKPRPVKYSTFFNLSPVGASALPSEVAACLSYSATPTAGISRARARGRLYIGPLATSALNSGILDGDVRPADGLRGALMWAGSRLAASTAATWSLYSRTDDAMRAISEVAVDNALDTQRRRGADPTIRERLAVPPAV